MRQEPKLKEKGLIIGWERKNGDILQKLAVFAVLMSFLLFGCLGIGEQSTVSSSGRTADYMPNAMGVESSAPPTDGQYITKEGYVSVKVKEGTLQGTYEEIKAQLKDAGAEIGNVAYNEYSDRKQYTITVKVRPADFESMMATIQKAGEVKDLSVNLEDVTKQYKDLETRITGNEIELQRLYELYNQSSKVSDLLEVEREISRVETELELLKQEKADLSGRIQKSTINITLYEDMPATQQLTVSLEGLASLFFTAMAVAVSLVVAAAGFLLPVVILLWLLWFAYKKLRPKPQKSGGSGRQQPQQ